METIENKTIMGSLRFMKWQDIYKVEKPFEVFFDPPQGAVDRRRTNIVLEEKDVPFHDVRGREKSYSLDTNGFMYCQRPYSFDNFQDQKAVEAIYFPEVESIIKSMVDGADKVTIFDWRLRHTGSLPVGATIDLNNPTHTLNAARHAHVDQSPAGVLNRVRRLHPEESNFLLRGRVRMINVWRPLSPIVLDWPLAVCDARTVESSDLVEVDHIRRSYQGLTFHLLHRPNQEWHYLSRQTNDELLLFKNFDSMPGVSAKCCPHASFKIADGGEMLPARESVEVRALVFTFPK